MNNNIELGDLVLFENEYHEDKIGVVTQIGIQPTPGFGVRSEPLCKIAQVRANPQHDEYHRGTNEFEVITHLTTEEKLTHASKVVRALVNRNDR